ncbi:MAG: rRNA maturation RNase YbeY [Phycisphaerales bacterium]
MPEKRTTNAGLKVNIFNGRKGFSFKKSKAAELVQKTSRKFGLRKALINIEIADDKRIVEVNKKFLKSGKITDVISFDVSEDDDKIFDIIVNAQLARRQAKLRGHSFEAELMLYIIHGLLHQLGFDDLTTRKAAKMHRMEDEILGKSGFGIVYGSCKR